MSYSQEMQKSIKTNDTVYSVPISTIRTYNRLVNEYEKCDESRDSLNSRIHTYQVTTEIQSIISKKNDSLLSDKDVIIGKQVKLINSYSEKENKNEKKVARQKTFISIFGIIAILEAIYIGFKTIIQ